MKNFRRDVFQLGWLDFGLSALASSFALFSVGMGLRQVEVAWFLMGFIVVGTLVSWAASRAVPDRYAWVSGLVYTVFAVCAVVYVQPLNSLLPMGGFPAQLVIAAALAWMIAIGSFLTWRDSTIVFQAVPSIALFGLVGAWDTFAQAPFAFFGFLLCFATLFARAHGRVMMLQAQESGYAPAGGSSVFATASDIAATFYENLKQGPWRWMAGPEWALGSAAVIIMLSVLGAPLFQSSVQAVAGRVQFAVPQAAPTLTASSSAFTPSATGSVSVGQGPRNNLQKKPVFRIRINDRRPHYLRQRTYDAYTGRGWRQVGDFTSQAVMNQAIQSERSFMNRSRLQIDPHEKLSFEIRFIDGYQESVPIPGELDFLNNNQFFARREDGSVRLLDNSGRVDRVDGVSRIPVSSDLPVNAVKDDMENYRSDFGTRPTDRVRALALQVVADATTDYEKALAIKQAVSSRITYDLKAAGVPAGSDAVDWVLFEGKRGYCDLFASAVVVMARSAGLPARYATGFYPALGVRDERGRWILHQSEAHAWAEIYFEKHGWVAIDATEGAQNVGDPTAEQSLLEQEWVRVILFSFAGLAVVLAPVGIAYIARKRRPVKDPVRYALGKHYSRFVAAVERCTGKPKRPSQTPHEYFETVKDLLGEHAADAHQLTAAYTEAMYAPDGAKPERLAELQAATIAFRRSTGRRR